MADRRTIEIYIVMDESGLLSTMIRTLRLNARSRNGEKMQT
jgi:hypothetical protein